eukprot:362858-Chlamydomonas_euryale.AAC.4
MSGAKIRPASPAIADQHTNTALMRMTRPPSSFQSKPFNSVPAHQQTLDRRPAHHGDTRQVSQHTRKPLNFRPAHQHDIQRPASIPA